LGVKMENLKVEYRETPPTNPGEAPFPETAFRHGYIKEDRVARTGKVLTPEQNNPHISVDSDFLRASPEMQEYIAMHEIDHAIEYQALLDKYTPAEASQRWYRRSFAYDERLYQQKELETEARVMGKLEEKYGSYDRIPKEIRDYHEVKVKETEARIRELDKKK
jgi:hypothetical protein